MFAVKRRDSHNADNAARSLAFDETIKITGNDHRYSRRKNHGESAVDRATANRNASGAM